mgnify:CR=1 FL=1
MTDESLSLPDMNWRLVEDAKEAIARKDWMLALSLFEQSRRICNNEGWREGVHYADDMILDIYPMVKLLIDDSNKFQEENRKNFIMNEITFTDASSGKQVGEFLYSIIGKSFTKGD